MLLNNFTSTMYPIMSTTTTYGGTYNLPSASNSINSAPSSSYHENNIINNFYPNFRGIAFGSGTTPPQKTDYKLESYISTGLTYSGNNNNETNKIVNWVQTVQNTSTEPITITEIGLFSGNTANTAAVVLLTRTVLDTPVILQPNEVKTFTITIDYNKFVDGTTIQNI